MIRRNTSLARVEGLSEQPNETSVPRRRSPVSRTTQHQLAHDASSPPSSPRRLVCRSPPSSSGGVTNGGRQSRPRAGGGVGGSATRSTSTWPPRSTAFSGMLPRGKAGGDDGGDSTQQRETENVGDPSTGKGPKGLFRLRAGVVLWRRLVALLAVGLCVLAGGQRLAGLPQGREEKSGGASPKLRGMTRRRARPVPEVLSSEETRYCSAPLNYPLAQRPSSRDGDSTGAASVDGAGNGLELRQLQVTIRHGDRSAIHDVPNSDEKKWKCQPFSDEVRRKWENVSRFTMQNVKGEPLGRSLVPEVYSEEELGDLGREFQGQADVLCKPGQLTETGIRQHLTLGDNMHKAYNSLFGGDLAAEEIYVRSTDYTRTLESAAAFLMSFIPGSSEITIMTDENENNEVMHGIGLKAIGKEQGGSGPEEETSGACDRAARLAEHQIRTFKPRRDVAADLRGLFGEEVSGLKMTTVADSMHSLSCHNMTLPCSDEGCVSATLALSVMAEADRQMCLKYNGAAGGGEATALSLHPFTSEILTNMREVLSGKSAMKFALFSGHDTVVAPLLAALGAYDCRWPPYASHVAFELWSKPASGEGEDGPFRRGLSVEGVGGNAAAGAADWAGAGDGSRSGGGAGGLARGRGEGVAMNGGSLSLGGVSPGGGGGGKDPGLARRVEEEEEAYVRVTFQGEPVTHRITDCAGDGPYGREFCPLSQFAKTISRALGSHDNLDEACEDLDGVP
ncbi:unnamed protein product [Scytosiphon promiscuus]